MLPNAISTYVRFYDAFILPIQHFAFAFSSSFLFHRHLLTFSLHTTIRTHLDDLLNLLGFWFCIYSSRPPVHIQHHHPFLQPVLFSTCSQRHLAFLCTGKLTLCFGSDCMHIKYFMYRNPNPIMPPMPPFLSSHALPIVGLLAARYENQPSQ